MTAEVLSPNGLLIVKALVGPLEPLEPVGTPAATPSAQLCEQLGFTIAGGDGIDPVLTISLGSACMAQVELPPGRYVLDLRAQVMAASKELPLAFDIMANEVTELTVPVDLGIR